MTLLFLAALGLAAVLVLAAYIRLAPSDPARWHIALPEQGPADCTLHPSEGAARFSCLLPEAPETALARLDAIALATPRTTRLAGSPATGRITWITRTALWGFPDYTTAQATVTPQGTRLDLYARLRFGGGDMGVNAARLADWTGRLGL